MIYKEITQQGCFSAVAISCEVQVWNRPASIHHRQNWQEKIDQRVEDKNAWERL